MSHYIECPKCGESTLDVDTHSCDCGYSMSLAEELLDAAQDAINPQQLISAAKEIERLTADLTASRQEIEGLRERNKTLEHVMVALNEATDLLDDYGRPEGERIAKGIKAIWDRATSSEQQLAELKAGYAEVVEVLHISFEILNEEEFYTDTNRNLLLGKIREAIASTPQSIKDVLAVIEAAKEVLSKRIEFNEQGQTIGGTALGVSLGKLEYAVRQLEGNKHG